MRATENTQFYIVNIPNDALTKICNEHNYHHVLILVRLFVRIIFDDI